MVRPVSCCQVSENRIRPPLAPRSFRSLGIPSKSRTLMSLARSTGKSCIDRALSLSGACCLVRLVHPVNSTVTKLIVRQRMNLKTRWAVDIHTCCFGVVFLRPVAVNFISIPQVVRIPWLCKTKRRLASRAEMSTHRGCSRRHPEYRCPVRQTAPTISAGDQLRHFFPRGSPRHKAWRCWKNQTQPTARRNTLRLPIRIALASSFVRGSSSFLSSLREGDLKAKEDPWY